MTTGPDTLAESHARTERARAWLFRLREGHLAGRAGAVIAARAAEIRKQIEERRPDAAGSG